MREDMGVLYITVFKMLKSDVKYWLVMFIVFLINFGFVMCAGLQPTAPPT